jgi:hypothetical protein
MARQPHPRRRQATPDHLRRAATCDVQPWWDRALGASAVASAGLGRVAVVVRNRIVGIPDTQFLFEAGGIARPERVGLVVTGESGRRPIVLVATSQDTLRICHLPYQTGALSISGGIRSSAAGRHPPGARTPGRLRPRGGVGGWPHDATGRLDRRRGGGWPPSPAGESSAPTRASQAPVAEPLSCS